MRNYIKKEKFLALIFFLISPFIFNTLGLANEKTAAQGQKNSKEELASSKDNFDEVISLDYKNADLTNVLRSLSWTYKLNIVTSSDIKGKVTINLKDVSVRKALRAILAINGLTSSEREGIIYISPGDPDVVEMQSEVIFLKYISASEAQNLLRKIISSKGDMKISEASNSLIITDFSENIKKVKFLLEKIDIPPQQVLIEAKIVDITSKDLKAIGIAWEADYQPNSGGLFDRSTRTSEQLQGNMDMASQSTDLSGGQFELETLTLKGLTVTATVDALVRQGKATLLASPSIAVLNGQEARIVIGQRYPYKERTQTTSGTTESTKFVDIGTNLRVTPQINSDGYITMRIHPEVSSFHSALDAGPRIITREADTYVRVKEGETLIIGGLIEQRDDSPYDKIPILGSIPIIGFLFSRREHDKEQKELAVFITPRILRSKEEKEAMNRKKAAKEEVYIALEKVAKSNLIEKTFVDAHALYKGKGLQSAGKDELTRKAHALNLYEYIAMQFPKDQRASEAMYQAGMIYQKDLKNYKKAKEVFSRIISDYPKSHFAEKARQQYDNIESSFEAEKKPKSSKAKKLERKDKAIKDEKDRDDRELIAGTTYEIGLGYIYALENYEEARRIFQYIISKYPGSSFSKKAAKQFNKIKKR